MCIIPVRKNNNVRTHVHCLRRRHEHSRLYVSYPSQHVFRVVANGPVGPAMAGPMIEPANFIFYFLKFFIKYFGPEY